jgi:hypothetical protein
MTKMENFAGSRKVAHILKVWSLLSTKIPISSRSVENSSVMSHCYILTFYKVFIMSIIFAKETIMGLSFTSAAPDASQNRWVQHTEKTFLPKWLEITSSSIFPAI